MIKVNEKISYIKPYKSRHRFKDYNIYFSDIETILVDNIHNPVSISLVGDDDECIIFNDITSYISYIKNNIKKSLIYFHNFGKFDSTFILNELVKTESTSNIHIIERNNIIYQLELRDLKVLFRDSYLIIPISLEKIGENFCEIHRKNELDYSDITNIYYKDPDIIHRQCIKDTLVLKEGFYNYKKSVEDEFKIDMLDNLTLPSLSYNIFKMSYYNFDKCPIAKNPYNVDEFIRRSYKGGISEVYKPYMKNGYCYDANSLYPFIMKESKFPVGKGKFVKGENIDINNFIGFIECEIISDNEYNFLTYRCEKRGLITPKGKWIDVYYYTEILKALELGYNIKYLKGFKYESEDYMFKEFVSDIYSKRINSKTQSMNNIAKLLLNSLYGRFGMKIFVESTKFLTEEEVFEAKKMYSFMNVVKIGDSKFYNVNVRRISNDKKSLYANSINTETAVHIASVITANARLYMYKFKNIKDNICYYTDTDSIFVKNKLDDRYIGKELGMFKLEYTIDEAIFIAPKVYYTRNIEGYNKLVIKGMKVNSESHKESIISEFKNIIDKNDFVSYIYERISIFRRNLNKLLTYKEVTIINFKFPFNKRIKIYKDNRWVDTKALNIKRLGSFELSEKKY
jgi:hypothetical protein